LFQIDVVNSEQELYEMAEEWAELLQNSHSNTIFLTFEWISTWWKYLKDDRELMILTARDENEKLIGIAPLMRSKCRFLHFLRLNVVEFLGSVHSDYLDFILLKDKEEGILEAIFKYLMEHDSEWDILNLLDIPDNSETLKYIPKKLIELNHTNNVKSVCPYINLPDKWELYLLSLSKKRRKKLKYYLRRLKKDFHFQFGEVGEKDNIKEKMDKLYSMHERRWKERGAVGDFSDYNFAQFHKAIASNFLEINRLDLFYLSINGDIVSMLYAFRYNQKTFYYQSGFDPKYTKYSIGTVLLGCCIENAISKGMKEFDFLRGNELYKYDWGANQYRKNIHCQIYNKKLSIFIYRFSMSIKVWLKNKIQAIMPRAVIKFMKNMT